jgi:hypothetical protein
MGLLGRTGRVCLVVLSAELEQQLEKSWVVLSPRPLSALAPMSRQTLPPRASPSDDEEDDSFLEE